MGTGLVVVLLVGSNSACLFLGYLFGRMARATVQIEENMVTDVPETPPDRAPAARDRQHRTNALRLLGVAVALIGVITAGMGYTVIRQQDRIVGCVVGYSNANSAALKARAQAQNEVNAQLDNFMAAILQAFSSAPAEGRQLVFDAVTAYNDARTAAKEAQSRNPLPDPPEHACAELMD